MRHVQNDATIPPPDQRIQFRMGAGIMAAIGGGLSEGSIGSAVSGSSLGIIYGTAAGYKSGVRLWGGTVSFAEARRSDVPLGLEKPRDLPVPFKRKSVPILSQDIADAIESGVFGKVTGPYRIYAEPELQKELQVAAREAKARQAAQVRRVRFVGAPPAQVACYY